MPCSGFRHISFSEIPVDRRSHFSADALNKYDGFLHILPWTVSFQVEAIVRKRAVSIQEMVLVLPVTDDFVRSEREKVTASFLQDVSPRLYASYQSGAPEDSTPKAVVLCFKTAWDEFSSQLAHHDIGAGYDNLYWAMHLTVTPTTTILDGPFPEPSNRVIRKYQAHQESFIRVTFADEGWILMKYDREIDNWEHISDRIGRSGLKEHTVWFVKPFEVSPGRLVSTNEIVANLGQFDDLTFDPYLTRYPARIFGSSYNALEIARAVDRPTPFYLNRPLIMLLEDLGIPYEVFEKFQDRAVQEANAAPSTLSKASKMVESHGSGTSFRLSSIMNSLQKLGISALHDDRFYDKSMEFAKNHVLRELKHHSCAWCLDLGRRCGHTSISSARRSIRLHSTPPWKPFFYLEGLVAICRSPAIHPGDVQVVHAIGKPPIGSGFKKEPLANTVVFSVLGDQPLPSYLGGGDLDGDVYNLIPLSDPELAGFEPADTYEPGEYKAAEKYYIDRRCNLQDVAEFVMDYLVSDVIGIIVTSWLKIADQSPDGIFDDACYTLAELHSDAVDYPKSGFAVELKRIPRLKHNIAPDWAAPETIDTASPGKFYPSQRAIGILFRAIDLPAEVAPI